MQWLFGLGLLALIGLRQPVLVLLGIAVLCLHIFYADGHPEYLIYDTWQALNLSQLLAVPLFLFAFAIMGRGSLGPRLVDFSVVLTRPLPGGLALGTLLAVAGFAAIAGSATVALLVIGSTLYDALLDEGYEAPFAIGLICASSVLGLVVPPSIAFILYGAITNTSVTTLFIAGIGPAVLLTCLFGAYLLFWIARRRQAAGGDRNAWDAGELWAVTRRALPALPVPAIILGGIYGGYFSLTEAAVVALLLALFIELLVCRDLGLSELWEVVDLTCRRLGGLVLVLTFAFSLYTFVVFAQIPQQALAALQSSVDSPIEFLLLANLSMLLLGMLLDAGSAVLVLSPMLASLAEGFGIHPAQLGTLMILNIGLGHLTPPAGSILIVAMGVFRTNFADVVRALLPFIGLMLVALVLVSLVPAISTFLIVQ